MSAPLLPRLAEATTSTRDPHYLVHRRLFSAIQSASRLARGVLLDIGCGNKPYASFFSDVVTAHIGCDIAQSNHMRVDIICSSDCIPLPDRSVDTILCTQVIEHVPDPGALVAESHRLLRDGGTLILSGPQYWPLHEEPHDFHRFTKYGFIHLVESRGFKVLHIEENGGRWATVGLALLHALPKSLRRNRAQRALNKVFAYLDDRFPGEGNPSNYLLSAQKLSDRSPTAVSQ